MTPREARALDVLYGATCFGLFGLLLMSVDILGLLRLGETGQMLGGALAIDSVMFSALLKDMVGQTRKGREATALGNLAFCTFLGDWLLGHWIAQHGWSPSGLVVTWIPYFALGSILVLRWFYGGRQAAWFSMGPVVAS